MAILTSGHSPGFQSVAVETAKGRAIITGFCCIGEYFNVPEAVTDLDPSWIVCTPGWRTDTLAAFDSTVKVKELADMVIAHQKVELEGVEKIP